MTDTRISLDEGLARLEILDLFARYCRAVDTCDFSIFDDVFTEGVIADYSEVRSPGDEPIIRSRDDFAAWLTESVGAIGPGMTHFMTNHLITVSGDEASVISYNHVLNVGMGGVYHSHAVRTGEGWRIDEIRFEGRYFAAIADVLNATMPSAGTPS